MSLYGQHRPLHDTSIKRWLKMGGGIVPQSPRVTAQSIPGSFGEWVKAAAGLRMSLLMRSHDRVAVLLHDGSKCGPKLSGDCLSMFTVDNCLA